MKVEAILVKIEDYIEKREIILDFYNQAVALFGMVCDDIIGFRYLYDFDIIDGDLTDVKNKRFLIDLETKVIERKRQLLIELGRIGEYAIKYVLLLKQVNDYPKQSIEEFKQKAIYNIADKGVGNTYINQYHMSQKIVDEIRLIKNRHTLQPLHDYNYLFNMLKELYPDIVNDIYKIIELKVQQQVIMDSKLPEELKMSYSYFPERIALGLTSFSDEEIKQYKGEFDRIIQDSGDAFVRLRYIDNNMNNKQYDLKLTLEMLSYLIAYIQLIHEINHDDLNLDITIAFRKDDIIKKKKTEIVENSLTDDDYNDMRMKLHEVLRQIEELFAIDRIAQSTNLQDAIFCKSSLSIEEIRRLLTIDCTDEELCALICNNVKDEYKNNPEIR